jgi:hypothetical protein
MSRGFFVLMAEVFEVTHRRFPPPWTVDRLPGGFKVIDANGQSLAYFYARENDHDANTAGVLTIDEARRLASNFAKPPTLLSKDSDGFGFGRRSLPYWSNTVAVGMVNSHSVGGFNKGKQNAS